MKCSKNNTFNYRQEEAWQKMRTVVNPIMMQPKAMKLYIPQVEAISNEFLTM